MSATKATAEQWAEAAKWRAEGMTIKAIAEKLGVTQGRASQKLGKRREKLAEPAPAPLQTA